MADQFAAGKYFRGYLASNDITTAAVIPLFDMDGNAITLANGQRPIIDEILLSNGGTAAVMTVFADTNGGGTLDAGEELVRASLAINSAQAFPAAGGSPIAGRVGATGNKNRLMAVASAASANSTVIVVGRLTNS